MEYIRLKDVDIKSQLGNRLYLLFIVKDISVRPQKDGGEFMVFNMVDRDKMVEAKIFGITPEIKNKVIEGKVYEGVIDVKNYKKNGVDILSCIVYGMEESTIDPSTFADWAENLQFYSDSLCSILNEANGTIYGDIARALVVKHWERFVRWPAARGQHHTQLGGLLWHTATVVELAVLTAKVYQRIYGVSFINMPLLIAGAILHDIMKTRELKVDVVAGLTDYSNEAALSTHIMDVLTEIDIEASNRGILYTEEVQLLKHVVASHHGKLEWGSPITGNVPEAHIIFKMDELDAEMWRFNKDFKDIVPGQHESVWRSGELTVRFKESAK